MILINNTTQEETLVPRWYFGGLAAAGAACVTHPLDLLKVQMQTHKGKNLTMLQLTGIVLKNQGILGLYNGISASLLRQLSYSTVRFAIYEQEKQQLAPKDGRPIPFLLSAVMAGIGGFAGGFLGNPADLVNVRMQNDAKLPPEQRRNYKNAMHGLWQVTKTEGILRLWTGSSMTCTRAALMTIGQLSFYDLTKNVLLSTPYFEDNIVTHMSSSLVAGAVATALTQPVDVLKTRAMNAKPGEVKSVLNLITSTAKEGPQAFFKGFIPAFTRLGPHSVLTFILFEQLRMHFGFPRDYLHHTHI